MSSFDILTAPGNLGFYQSCEVTEIYLCRKHDKAILNFYTLAVFEERSFEGRNKQFLGDRIRVGDAYSLGLRRYWLTFEEAKDCYTHLSQGNQWSFEGITFSDIPQLRQLPKQFLQSVNGGRLNNAVKNNFHAGTHLLEFFDENKTNAAFLLESGAVSQFNTLCDKISARVPLHLNTARDRVGNFMFQFPVTIVDINVRNTKNYDGVDVYLSWHPDLPAPPDCTLMLAAILDEHFMGCAVEDYNKSPYQQIVSGSLDQKYHFMLWRKDPGLILYSSNGVFFRGIQFNMSTSGTHFRQFEIDGKMMQVDIAVPSGPQAKPLRQEYTSLVQGNLYRAEKAELERTLSFKQYKKLVPNALDDIRLLIQQQDKNGIYLWDPFLRPREIFQTLYFSKTANVPLKAICCINDTVRLINDLSHKTPLEIVALYRNQFENPTSNNSLLNLEFRMQHGVHGWPFHDRFLIFPHGDGQPPKVYSLGTSVSSYGKSHHILQEVLHPQPVLDAFNELWDQLNHDDCLVWKYPNP